MTRLLFNGLCDNDELNRFTAFCITPVNIEDGEGVVMSDPDHAEFFSLFGHDDHEWRLVHDCMDEDAGQAVVTLCQILGRAVIYRDTFFASSQGTPADLCDYLTGRIHDEIPGYDDPEDFREDAFDSHPLAGLREQLVAALVLVHLTQDTL
jgi:hypothetical protein